LRSGCTADLVSPRIAFAQIMAIVGGNERQPQLTPELDQPLVGDSLLRRPLA